MAAQDFAAKFHKLSVPAEGVLLIEMNRPPVNAFHNDMWSELQAIVEGTSQDPAIRAIVLSSTSDKVFTAGLDVKSALKTFAAEDVDPARSAIRLHHHIKAFQNAIGSFEKALQPVIVALHGSAIGLAIDISSACDIRLAAEDATFAIAEVNVGLAADMGTLQRFPKIIGNGSKAKELAITGRPFTAAEAKEIGFVSDVVKGGRQEVVGAALKMAKFIASKSPVAVVGTKHLINYSRDHGVQDGLDYTQAWNMSMLQAKDTMISLQSVLAKKTPDYPPIRPVKSKL